MKCDVCSRTEEECKIKTINNMKLCPKHLTQYYRYGKFLPSTIYDRSEIITYDNYAEIILKDKYQHIVGKAIIDIEDVKICSEYKWHIRRSGNNQYAVASLPNNRKIHLHRLVLDYEGKDDVDHIDHNGLNNRKANLRIISHADNIRNQKINRKGIKRVSSGRYQVTITQNYITKYLGTYDTYEEALQARLNAE